MSTQYGVIVQLISDRLTSFDEFLNVIKMKPAKKDNDSNKNLKQMTDNSSASKIKSYFKPAQKSFVVPVQSKNANAEGGPKQFYVQMLKDKIQEINGTDSEDSNQMDGACALIEKPSEIDQTRDDGGASSLTIKKAGCSGCKCSECEQQRNESNDWERNYKELKKVYLKLAVSYSELDLKHKDLLKAVNGNKISVNDSPTANEAACYHTTDKAAGGHTTDKATGGDILSAGEVKFVECMPLDKNKDSTFVLQCLQFIYKDNPTIMTTKSLFGTKEKITFTDDGGEEHQPAKQPLTPLKVSRIRQLFTNRISTCVIHSDDNGERIKQTYLNKLIASGIKNMAKNKN